MANVDEIGFVSQSVEITNAKQEDITNQILKLLPLLIGNLHSSDIKYTISTNSNFKHYAFSNILFHIIAENKNENKNENKTDEKKEYLFRIYGTSSFLIQRENEEFIAKILGFKQFGPKIYATFNNGRIEEYYSNSTVIDPLCGFKQEQKYKQISKQISILHSIKVNNDLQKYKLKLDTFWSRVYKWYNITKNFDLNKSYNGNEKKYKIWQKIYENNYMISLTKWTKNITPNTEEFGIKNGQKNAIKIMKFHYGNKLNIDYIRLHRELYLEYIARSFFYEMILSHNDISTGNLLYLLNEVKLIDFEYISHNFRGFDLGVLIVAAPCKQRVFEGEKDIMLAHERKLFIGSYLMQFINNKQYEFGDIYNNKNEWNLLINICDIIIIEFIMIVKYHWGLWAVMQSVFAKIHSIPYIDFAYNRLVFSMEIYKTYWNKLYDKQIEKYCIKSITILIDGYVRLIIEKIFDNDKQLQMPTKINDLISMYCIFSCTN